MKKLFITLALLTFGQVTFAANYSNPNDPIYTPSTEVNRCHEFVGDSKVECQDYNRQAAEAGCVGLTEEALAILADKNLIAGCIFANFQLRFTFTCKCGCFHPNTEISTANGSTLVDEIVAAPGMYDIHGFSAQGQYTNEFNDVHEVSKGDNLEPLVSVSAGGHSLTVTASHPVVVQVNGSDDLIVIKASELNDATHQMVLAGGTTVAIDSLDKDVSYYGRVYNFSTGTKESDMADHIVSANGLLTGDLYLQNSLGHEAAALSARQ